MKMNNKKFLKVLILIGIVNMATACGSNDSDVDSKEKIVSESIVEETTKESTKESIVNEKVAPEKVVMPLLDKTEMVIGDSRIIETNFMSKNPKLDDKDFKNVTERELKWDVEPKGIVTIDDYGRVEAIKEGKVEVKITSIANSNAIDTKIINVVKEPTKVEVEKRIINFEGQPVKQEIGIQKTVDFYTSEKIEENKNIPVAVKEGLKNIENKIEKKVISENITWEIVDFSDGSDNQYILRTDNDLEDKDRDKLQYFMGARYLPGNGKSPRSIISDGENGIWVIGDSEQSPLISQIKIAEMGYKEKAKLMNETTDEFVSRMGFIYGARLEDGEWVKIITDNDGLWTALYDTGELMHYSIAKNDGTSKEELEVIRRRALKSLKSVLLLGNIAGREGTTDAKIRHLANTRIGDGNHTKIGEGNKSSGEYLKKGKVYAVDNFSGNPSEKMSYTGIDSQTVTEDGERIGGEYKYSLGPINDEDWTTEGEAATTKRTLSGFIARTIAIPNVEDVPYKDGLFIQRDGEGNQKILSGAERLYDYSGNETPTLKLGNRPLQEELKEVLNYDGTQYEVEDIVYKADTSTDEIIGHLFLYKTAFDILDDNDPEEKKLKEIVVETVKRYSQHMIDNGYGLVDATGQGTTWGKTTKDYFNNDFAFEDAPLNALVLLSAFKLAYYVTGETKWQDEYELLAKDSSFDYVGLSNQYYDRWKWIGNNDDYDVDDNLRQFDKDANPSEVEVDRHALYSVNKSDEEMAMMAYYLLFQMEDDENLLDEYKIGLEGWWHSVGLHRNPLWNYIYQLAYPNEVKVDKYGDNLLEVSAWELKRSPVSRLGAGAFYYGSRPDVINDSGFSVNPNEVIGTRVNNTDITNADLETNFKVSKDYDPKNIYQITVLPQDEQSIRKFNGTTFENVEGGKNERLWGPATYTLPYWFGRYHGMLAE